MASQNIELVPLEAGPLPTSSSSTSPAGNRINRATRSFDGRVSQDTSSKRRTNSVTGPDFVPHDNTTRRSRDNEGTTGFSRQLQSGQLKHTPGLASQRPHRLFAKALAQRHRHSPNQSHVFDPANMKFSHSLQFNSIPDWSAYYIAYDNLKKLYVRLLRLFVILY